MQRKADEIFRVKDLSLLKSPIPGHIRSSPSTPHQKTELDNSCNNLHLPNQKIFASSPGIIRPSFLTPKPMMGPPPIRLKPSPSLSGIRMETKTEEQVVESVENTVATFLENGTSDNVAIDSTCIIAEETKSVTNENVETKDNNEIIQPDEISFKNRSEMVQPHHNECLLENWYFQKIPNNPKFSNVERDVSEEWIVLVGMKPEMSELWHSSIVTGRLDKNAVSTGSGKIYRLLNFDEAALIGAGFDSILAKKFKNGFPEDWKKILIKSLSVDKRQKRIKSGTPLSKMTKSTQKTPERRHSLPSAFISETPTIVGATRSGRKVVTPIPFWNSKVASSYKPSPTLNIKRRWGNRIVYETDNGKTIL